MEYIYEVVILSSQGKIRKVQTKKRSEIMLNLRS